MLSGVIGSFISEHAGGGRVWGGEREAEGRPEKRGQERSGDGGGETVLVRHPTVFVFMMKDVPETQGKIFGLC